MEQQTVSWPQPVSQMRVTDDETGWSKLSVIIPVLAALSAIFLIVLFCNNGGIVNSSKPVTASQAFNARGVWFRYASNAIGKDVRVTEILEFDGKGNVTAYHMPSGIKFASLRSIKGDAIIDFAKQQDRKAFMASKEEAVERVYDKQASALYEKLQREYDKKTYESALAANVDGGGKKSLSSKANSDNTTSNDKAQAGGEHDSVSPNSPNGANNPSNPNHPATIDGANATSDKDHSAAAATATATTTTTASAASRIAKSESKLRAWYELKIKVAKLRLEVSKLMQRKLDVIAYHAPKPTRFVLKADTDNIGAPVKAETLWYDSEVYRVKGLAKLKFDDKDIERAVKAGTSVAGYLANLEKKWSDPEFGLNNSDISSHDDRPLWERISYHINRTELPLVPNAKQPIYDMWFAGFGRLVLRVGVQSAGFMLDPVNTKAIDNKN